jgi:soluble lytic murein transglycosylase-like protein
LTQTINAYLQPQSSSDDSVTPSENVSNGYSTEGMQQVQNSPMLASVSDDVKTKILDCVKRACEQYNVDPRLVIALMKTESSFNPNAKSSAGAIGLMQLMPETAKSCGATNPYDIEQNIFAGVKYLKEMLDRYNGNVDLALAAYNAGPGKVTDKIPDIAETKNHVAEVNKNYQELMA